MLAELWIGVPPPIEGRGQPGFVVGLIMVVLIAAAFVLLARLVLWTEAKAELWQLLREIRREHRRISRRSRRQEEG